jgi:hypothetical protein
MRDVAVVSPAVRSSWIWAALAACFPLVACPVTPVVAVVSAGAQHEPTRLFVEGGPLAYLSLGVFVFSAMALAVLCAFAARGSRVPVAVLLVLAVLPWLVGVAGMRLGLVATMGAVGNVNPLDKVTILAAGISEATCCRLLGTFLSAGLLAALGLSLAVGAIGTARKSNGLGAVAGLAATAPMLAACLVVPNFHELGPVGYLPLLAAMALVFAGAMGGMSLNGDGRSSLLAATLVFPAGLAVTALATGVGVTGMMELFRALAMVSPADRATIAVQGSLELATADRLAMVSWGAGALGVLVLAGLAFSRFGAPAERPPEPSVRTALGVELAVCAVVAVLVVAADQSAVRSAAAMIDSTRSQPWSSVPGFTPLRARGSQQGYQPWVLSPDALVTAEGAVVGQPFSEAGLAESAARFAEELSRDDSRRAGARPPPGHGDFETPFDSAEQNQEQPERRAARTFTVAVDARVKPVDFAKVMAAARKAGFGKLELVGANPKTPTASAGSAWWLGLLSNAAAETFWLEPDGERVVAVVGPAQLESALDGAGKQPALEVTAYGLQGSLDAADKLERASIREPLLYGPEGVPAPKPPVEPAVVDAVEARGGEASNDVVEGVGKLDRAEVAKVVRAHLAELRACYEARLRENPKLAGKVVITFEVAPSGQVRSAEAEASTLDDSSLEACLVRRMKTLRFPKPVGGSVVVSYPLVFKPN